MALPAAQLAPPSISDLIDLALEAKYQTEGEREITGGATWRASLLGYCLRRQYLEAVEKRPPIHPIDAKTRRVFEVGHQTSEWFTNLMDLLGIVKGTEVDLYDADLDVGAHVDLILGGPVQDCSNSDFKDARLFQAAVRAHQMLTGRFGETLPTIGIELKSKNSKAFWWAKKNGEQTVASPHQLVQAALYADLAERQGLGVDHWVVATVSKDDLTIAEDEVLPFMRKAALNRLAILNEAKRTGVPPDCSCIGQDEYYPQKKSWVWKFCPYYQGSAQSRKPKGDGGGSVPDGGCC